MIKTFSQLLKATIFHCETCCSTDSIPDCFLYRNIVCNLWSMYKYNISVCVSKFILVCFDILNICNYSMMGIKYEPICFSEVSRWFSNNYQYKFFSIDLVFLQLHQFGKKAMKEKSNCNVYTSMHDV